MEPEKLYKKKKPEEEYSDNYQSQDSSSQYSGCSGSGCSSCSYSCG